MQLGSDVFRTPYKLIIHSMKCLSGERIKWIKKPETEKNRGQCSLLKDYMYIMNLQSRILWISECIALTW